MKKRKKLSPTQLHSLAMIKYEFQTISKIMVVGLPFLIILFAFIGKAPTNTEDAELINGLTLTAILVLIQSIVFLVLLRRFKQEINEYLATNY